jgi:parallel beta-helix repeat protein
MLYVNDSSRVWHVAKTGNDANSGHAGQYPVNLANDAKLTIGAAVSAASPGDTIVIWPGDYAETVNASSKSLNIIGIHKGTTRIVPTSGMYALQVGNNSYVKNLDAINSAGNIGISLTAKSNITIENCYAYGTTDGLYFSAANKIRLIDCYFSSPWDGANMGASQNCFVERCMFETTGESNNDHALQLPGNGVYRDCIFYAVTSATGGSRFGAVEMGSGYTIKAVFENCYFNVSAPAGRTGGVFGIKVDDANALAILNGCVLKVLGPGASGGPIDLHQSNGSIIVNGCGYSTQSGTIIQGDSGWSNALGAALFTNGPANKLKIDAVGAVDAGNIEDIDLALLHKAAKMLLNKAVQDKLSGVIRYYDDDGQTVVLTHTPNEDESSLTRTVS